jgi:hypothetical protein
MIQHVTQPLVQMTQAVFNQLQRQNKLLVQIATKVDELTRTDGVSEDKWKEIRVRTFHCLENFVTKISSLYLCIFSFHFPATRI